MFQRNGNPHGDPRGSRDERAAVSYEGGRINARNLDIAMLLKGIRDAVIIGGLVLTWIAPSLRPPQSPMTPEKIEEATYSGMTRALSDRNVTVETAPAKVVPMKGRGKGHAAPVPTPTPKGHSMLREGEVRAVDLSTLPLFSHNRIPIPEMKVPE